MNRILFLSGVIILCVLFGSCEFGDSRNVQLSFDGKEISESNAKISLIEEGEGVFNVHLFTRGDWVIIDWKVNDRNPENWVGHRFRAHRFKIVGKDFSFNFDGTEVAIIVEINDATGSMVCGRFSGSVGIGAGSHVISNGAFRAPVTFWKR